MPGTGHDKRVLDRLDRVCEDARRGDIYRLRVPKGLRNEQQGPRFGVASNVTRRGVTSICLAAIVLKYRCLDIEPRAAS
jgi:hypothetical protein